MKRLPFSEGYTEMTKEQAAGVNGAHSNNPEDTFIVCNWSGWYIVKQTNGTYMTESYSDSIEGTLEECIAFSQKEYNEGDY